MAELLPITSAVLEAGIFLNSSTSAGSGIWRLRYILFPTDIDISLPLCDCFVDEEILQRGLH